MSIEIKNLKKSYGELSVLDDFNLRIGEGEICCLLGNSGCGKTTVLNCLSGIAPYEGEISGRPERVSYVFQKERLLKNLTVAENIAYVLNGVYPKERVREEVDTVLELVELTEWRDRYPAELSGGMAQRVSIARAFGYPAPLLLMDEPFRALDLGLKTRVIAAFCRLWERDRKTVLFVTHDIDEALLLADRVCLMERKPAKITHAYEIASPRTGRKLSDTDILSVRAKICEDLGI